MANWKLTPFSIGCETIGITPEWTSGSGNYRVKRFSTQFPLFLHGSEDVIKGAIQLLRWSSKEDPANDLVVLLNLNGEAIKLFAAQAFVVEFFRRLWHRSEIYQQLMFVESKNLENYHYKSNLSISEQLVVISEFVKASSSMQVRGRQVCEASSIKIYEFCKEQRKASSKNLLSAVDPATLIASSMEVIKNFRSPYIFGSCENRKKSKTINPLVAKRKTLSDLQLKAVKELNSKRSRLNLSEQEKLDISFIFKESQKEREIEFKLGDLHSEKLGVVSDFKIYSFGCYFLLVISDSEMKVNHYLPFRNIKAAKQMIEKIDKATDFPSKNLCLKISSGIASYHISKIATLCDDTFDFFVDHWENTPFSFSVFSSLVTPEETVGDKVDIIGMVCKSAFDSQIKSSSSSLFS